MVKPFIGLINFVILACSLGLSAPAQARGPFSSSDFGLSGLATRTKTAHQEFATWAAQNANKVVELLKENSPILSILKFLGEERRALANRSGLEPSSDKFGKWRKDNLPWRTTIHGDELKPREGQVAKTIEHQFEKEGTPLFTVEKNEELLGSYQNFYVTSDGKKIPATRIEYAYKGFKAYGKVESRYAYNFFHPTGKNLDLIRNDVLDRLDALATGSVGEAFEDEFFRALNGYYQAMPYERGSAAIGRVFFAAFYYVKTGKKLADYREIDVESMIIDPAEFVGRHISTAPEVKKIESILFNGMCDTLLKRP